MSLDNYLAGHTKKSLRIGAKHITDLKAFVDDLPVELQLLVRTTHETFNIIITPAGPGAPASNRFIPLFPDFQILPSNCNGSCCSTSLEGSFYATSRFTYTASWCKGVTVGIYDFWTGYM